MIVAEHIIRKWIRIIPDRNTGKTKQTGKTKGLKTPRKGPQTSNIVSKFHGSMHLDPCNLCVIAHTFIIQPPTLKCCSWPLQIDLIVYYSRAVFIADIVHYLPQVLSEALFFLLNIWYTAMLLFSCFIFFSGNLLWSKGWLLCLQQDTKDPIHAQNKVHISVWIASFLEQFRTG